MTSRFLHYRWIVPVLAVTWLLAFFIGKKQEAAPPKSISPDSNVRSSLRARPPLISSPTSDTATGRTLAVIEQVERLQTRDEFRAALDDLIKFSDKTEKERYLALLFSHWLEVNPQEALLESRSVEMLRAHGQRIALAFEDWSRKNPLESSQLLQTAYSFSDSEQNELPFRDLIDPPDFIMSLYVGLLTADPTLAASLLSTAPESSIRSQSLSALTQYWFTQDPADAFDWVSNLPSDKPVLRQQAVSEVADRAGLSDNPQEGIEWANKLTTPTERTLALTNLSGQWSRRSASSAQEWASSLPDSDPNKFAVMPEIVRRLTLTDPGRAADWLNQYEAAPRMDASVAAYALTVQFSNPAAARGSAEAITDPQLRSDVQAQLGGSE